MPEHTLRWLGRVRPPESLVAGNVELRRWRATDAPVMHALITANTGHLRPTMPWIAHEPLTVDDRRLLLVGWEEDWESGTDFAYLVLHDGVPAGSAGLHNRRGPGILEIGYWVDAARTGRGVASSAASVLAGAALSLDGVESVEIHHDVSNTASGRVAAKVGFAMVGEYARVAEAPADTGVARRWERRRP